MYSYLVTITSVITLLPQSIGRFSSLLHPGDSISFLQTSLHNDKTSKRGIKY